MCLPTETFSLSNNFIQIVQEQGIHIIDVPAAAFFAAALAIVKCEIYLVVNLMYQQTVLLVYVSLDCVSYGWLLFGLESESHFC